MEIKICIAVVSNRGVKTKTALSLMEMIANTKVKVYPIIATEGFTIAENRHYAVAKAINAECSHILFIDDDMVFPKDTIERLLSHNKEIIGVKSYSRLLPLKPTIALIGKSGEPITDYTELPEKLFDCYSVGFGVCLIAVSLFEKIQRPYFDFQTISTGKVVVGEDEYFCNKAKEFTKIWCDPTLIIGHMGDYIY